MTKKFARPDEQCFLFPTAAVADRCRAFMKDQHAKLHPQDASLPVRIVRFSILGSNSSDSPLDSPQLDSSISSLPPQDHTPGSSTSHQQYIFIVFFPAPAFALAKAFWQHTGDGISSRRAERCLQLMEQNGSLDDETAGPDNASLSSSQILAAEPSKAPTSGKRFYNRYARNGSVTGTNFTPTVSASSSNSNSTAANFHTPTSNANPNGSNTPYDGSPMAAYLSSLPSSSSWTESEMITPDTVTYLEERYGRNLPLDAAPQAKRALRRRIAGTLLADREDQYQSGGEATDEAVAETSRSGTGVSEHDVYLFPSGMSSIFHAHQVAMIHRNLGRQNDETDGVEGGSAALQHKTRMGKSVCFGFPYTDTLKILQKWGPGCHFYGNGLDSDLDQFEKLLQNEEEQRASAVNEDDAPAPILALFCEFPSNPLLRSPDLPRIRKLADKYGFLVVVDETIGNFVNVEVLPYADLLVSSLTKVFSGDANVMSGSMVLNPKGPHASALRRVLEMHYEDTFFDEDALFLERNSRDFVKRVVQIDRNTRALTAMLQAEAQGRGKLPGGVIKNVFYPQFVARDNYEKCRRRKPLVPTAEEMEHEGGGYGGLFSLTFHSIAASQAFYDTLKCAKGPSLGTNYTLASPYTILAHYGELDWAEQFGVDRGLVRVSVGLESTEDLVEMFSESVKSAARAVGKL